MEQITQDQTAKIVGVTSETGSPEKYLVLQALEPEATFKYGGHNYGYLYEWQINKFYFIEKKARCCKRYNLTETEYYDWLSKLSTE